MSRVAVVTDSAAALPAESAQKHHIHVDCLELYVTEFTPVMGSVAGPGLVGLAFYSEDGGAGKLVATGRENARGCDSNRFRG